MSSVHARNILTVTVFALVCFACSANSACERGYHRVLYKTLTQETTEGGGSKEVEIHIRQNVKGKIVINKTPSQEIVVKVNWTYYQEGEFKRLIRTNYSTVSSLGGTIYVVQLDKLDDVGAHSIVVKIIVSISISGLILVLIVVLLCWCQVRKRRRKRSRANNTELHSLCNRDNTSNATNNSNRGHPQTELTYCAPTPILRTPVLIRTQKNNTGGKPVIPRIYNVQVSLSSPDGSTISSPVLQRTGGGTQAETKEIDPRVLETVLRQRGPPQATSSPKRTREDIELIKPEVLLVTKDQVNELSANIQALEAGAAEPGGESNSNPVRRVKRKKKPTAYKRNASTTLSSRSEPENTALTTTGSSDTDIQSAPEGRVHKVNGSPRHGNHHTESDSKSAGGGGRGVMRPNTLVLASFTILSLFSIVYASCFTDTQAEVTIFIPNSNKFRVRSIKIFTSAGGTLKPGSDFADIVQIFDTESSRLTENLPCYPKYTCPEVYNSTILGCDAGTKRCVCERGFRLKGQYCVDIDECLEGTHTCGEPHTCFNTFGSHRCQCPDGQFGSGAQCKACHEECPKGQYEFVQCTPASDRQCRTCSKCPQDTYEAVACKSHIDTQCLHVADPLMKFKSDGTKPTKGLQKEEEIKQWENSANLFVDDIYHADKFESYLFPLDNRQTGDVQWRRKSNLVVNVKLTDINLVPEYRDVDHKSDNLYMLNAALVGKPQELSEFQKVLGTYCRHPVPHNYALSLEIMRQRTSQIKTITCPGTDNHEKVKCPAHYSDGDTYSFRSLDEKCSRTAPEMKLEKINITANSVPCVGQPGLLTKVFKQEVMKEEPISYPETECLSAIWRCNQCLVKKGCIAEQLDCQRTFRECNKLQFDQHFRSMGEKANGTCCGIACYAEAHCKQAVKPECTSLPYECSTGDVQKYVISPSFENVTKEFRCHLRQKEPTTLLRMSYSVILPPPFKWNSPTITKTVFMNETTSKNERSGRAKADWLNFSFNRGLNAPQDVMLRSSLDSFNNQILKLHRMKAYKEFNKEDFSVYLYDLAKPLHTTHVQVATPFEYSTYNFLSGGCDKNVSRLFPAQEMYKNQPLAASVVAIPSSIDEVGFGYYAKASKARPRLNVSVQARQSIFKTFFEGTKRKLIYKSLKSHLHRNGRNWMLTISGNVSDCTTYLGITINERSTSQTIGKFDTFIGCFPKDSKLAMLGNTFSITFYVPPSGTKKEKSLEVVLEDSVTTHKIYVSSMFLSMQTEMRSLVDTSRNDTSSAMESDSLWTPVIQIAIVTGLSIILLLFGYICVTCCTSKKNQKTDSEENEEKLESTRVKRLIQISAYCIFKLIYNLTFTFTVSYLLVVLINKDALSKLDDFQQYRLNKFNERERFIGNITKHLNESLHKQYSVFNHMIGSGVNYTKDLSTAIEQRMSSVQRENLQKLNFSSVEVYTSKVCQAKLELYNAEMNLFLNEHKTDMRLQLDRLWFKYGKLLREVKANDWLGMLNQLFLRSASTNSKRSTPVDEDEMRTLISYLSFLGVDRAKGVETSTTYLYSLLEQVPDIPVMYSCKGDCVTELGVQHLLPTMSANNELSADATVLVDTNATFTYLELEPPREVSQTDDTNAFSQYMGTLWYSLPLAFVLLDALLLLYRFTSMYSMVKQFREGFDVKVAPDSLEDADSSRLQKELDIIKKQIIEDSDTDRLSSFYGTYRPSDHSISNRQLIDSSHSQSRTTVVFGHPGSTSSGKVCQFLQVIYRLLCCGMIPKLCCILFAIFVLVAGLDGVSDSVSADVIKSVAISLNVIPQSQMSYVTLANMLLADHATQLSGVLEVFRKQVDTQIYHLGALVDIFNFEQQQIARNYNTQLCNIQQSLTNFTSCSINIDINRVNLDILPTYFWPISANPYISSQLEVDAEDILQFTNSLKQFVFNTSYIIIGIIVFMVLFYLIGQLVFQLAKLTNQVKVNRIYHLSYCIVKGQQDQPRTSTGFKPRDGNGQKPLARVVGRNQNESDV